MSDTVKDTWIASSSQPLILRGKDTLFPVSLQLQQPLAAAIPKYVCLQGLHNVEQLGVLDIHISPLDSVLSEQSYLATAAFYGMDTQSDTGQELHVKLAQQEQQTLQTHLKNKQFITLVVALQPRLSLPEPVTIERIVLL
ncbi:hypothetical protein [Planctobacterium marinum]|uniref:hypothetical protein n=1 Tax=Planctobacterium marinum TaxID=1631968 RepID=UPI001E50F578|nr:hypothetical protein [Planctobacterium marinum]MCC2607009.1 hypothetical protein [Planctobacterium marinum]